MRRIRNQPNSIPQTKIEISIKIGVENRHETFNTDKATDLHNYEKLDTDPH